jgi:hypothetical protein
MEQIIYEQPESIATCDGWILWCNGDVTFLLVPDTSKRLSPLSVLVARDTDGDGIYQRAERYWLSDDDEATLAFLRRVFDGTTLN